MLLSCMYDIKLPSWWFNHKFRQRWVWLLSVNHVLVIGRWYDEIPFSQFHFNGSLYLRLSDLSLYTAFNKVGLSLAWREMSSLRVSVKVYTTTTVRILFQVNSMLMTPWSIVIKLGTRRKKKHAIIPRNFVVLHRGSCRGIKPTKSWYYTLNS